MTRTSRVSIHRWQRSDRVPLDDFFLRIHPDGETLVVNARLGTQTANEPLTLDLARTWDLSHLERSEAADEAGHTLFDALISGSVRNLFHQGRGGVSSGSSLPIRLRLDSRDPRVRPLLGLPWELMKDKGSDSRQWPALDIHRPIIRELDSNQEVLTPSAGKLQRVLLAMAQPTYTAELELDRELDLISEELGRVPIRPTLLSQVTRPRLADALSTKAPQIVHFMGHGLVDATRGEGQLLLATEEGGIDPIDASDFVTLFAASPVPRLVILAACFSGDPGDPDHFGPFSSVAAALVAAGFPAVVAMQTKVRDRPATRFAQRLYQSLVVGNSIETAVTNGRIALRAEHRGTLDWAVPVLYLRGPCEAPATQQESKTSEDKLPPPTPPKVEQNIQASEIGAIFGYVKEVHQHGGGGT
ncbi:MAG: CHAT domain-containing protein [Thermoanaerobaculia bacterium]|nr:CHAT domain-containing protein [Thermoanaerobaculia bacterium]